jgi:hypothetical protein
MPNLKAMEVKKRMSIGDYTYELLGTEEEASHIHINNHKTNNDSVLVPLDVFHYFMREPQIISEHDK